MKPTVLRKAAQSAPAVLPLDIDAPVSGKLVSLSQVPDEVFASGAMGEGVAILPGNGTIVAPCDGAVTYNMNFSHIIGVSARGIDILIHVGLDRVNLQVNPFCCHVRERQIVKKGDPLLTVNLDAMRQAGLRLFTLITIANPDRRTALAVPSGRTILAGERLMTVS